MQRRLTAMEMQKAVKRARYRFGNITDLVTAWSVLLRVQRGEPAHHLTAGWREAQRLADSRRVYGITDFSSDFSTDFLL